MASQNPSFGYVFMQFPSHAGEVIPPAGWADGCSPHTHPCPLYTFHSAPQQPCGAAREMGRKGNQHGVGPGVHTQGPCPPNLAPWPRGDLKAAGRGYSKSDHSVGRKRQRLWPEPAEESGTLGYLVPTMRLAPPHTPSSLTLPNSSVRTAL